MPRTVRTFIAVHLHAGAALRAVLASLADMGPAVRPVAADGLHVTLKFLGDTDAALIPAVAGAIRECVAGQGPFELRLTGLGAFPHPGRPSVVWAGIEDDDGRLKTGVRDRETPLAWGFEGHGEPAVGRGHDWHGTG